MKTDKYIRVLYDNRLVGTLALTAEKKAAFEYADEWLRMRSGIRLQGC